MIEEAHQFTIDALKYLGDVDRYKYHCAALWDKSDENFSISLNDPLFGENSLYANEHKGKNREFLSKTLDDLFSDNMPRKVSLLKIDLEGAGADVLEGAKNILQVTKHLVFEIHSEDECKRATKLLSNRGFYLRKISNRHLWWEHD
jgi:FkbM family methyltransferase